MGPRGDSPNRTEEILLWAYMVKPSFSQNSPQLALVTRFPNQLWAISWMMTSARERSPARRQGVTKVRQGFSIPPKGKDGGIKSTSYLPRAGGHTGCGSTPQCPPLPALPNTQLPAGLTGPLVQETSSLKTAESGAAHSDGKGKSAASPQRIPPPTQHLPACHCPETPTPGPPQSQPQRVSLAVLSSPPLHPGGREPQR